MDLLVTKREKIFKFNEEGLNIKLGNVTLEGKDENNGAIKANEIHTNTLKNASGDEIIKYVGLDNDNNLVDFSQNTEKIVMKNANGAFCFGDEENPDNCFNIDDLKVLKGITYFNIQNKDSDATDEILSCNSYKCQTFADSADKRVSDDYKFKIYREEANRSDSDSGERLTLTDPEIITSTQNKFSNIVSSCCNGEGNESLNDMIDQCKKNVNEKYKNKEECEAARTAYFLYGDDKKTLTCGVDCKEIINSKGKKTGKWSMTGVYDLRNNNDTDEKTKSIINAHRCNVAKANKYKNVEDCYEYINLPAVTIEADSYNGELTLSEDKIRCGSMCYNTSNSGGKWKIYDEYVEPDEPAEEGIAAYSAFRSDCSSKFNKSYGSKENCNKNSKVGRYYYNDVAEFSADNEKKAYKCGTCTKDVTNNKFAVMQFKKYDTDGDGVDIYDIGTNESLLGTTEEKLRSENDAQKMYYEQKKYGKQSKCEKALTTLKQSDYENDGVDGTIFTNYTCAKSNGKWRFSDTGSPIYEAVTTAYFAELLDFFDEKDTSYGELTPGQGMTSNEIKLLKEYIECLITNGVTTNEITSENMTNAANLYESKVDQDARIDLIYAVFIELKGSVSLSLLDCENNKIKKLIKKIENEILSQDDGESFPELTLPNPTDL